MANPPRSLDSPGYPTVMRATTPHDGAVAHRVLSGSEQKHPPPKAKTKQKNKQKTNLDPIRCHKCTKFEAVVTPNQKKPLRLRAEWRCR